MAKGLRPNGLKIAQGRVGLPGHVSQAAFAQRVGIHWVTQSNIENGKANVSLELLERIADELGVPRDELRADEADEEPHLGSMSDDLYEAVQAAAAASHAASAAAAAARRVFERLAA